jgi:hypothetical protein
VDTTNLTVNFVKCKMPFPQAVALATAPPPEVGPPPPPPKKGSLLMKNDGHSQKGHFGGSPLFFNKVSQPTGLCITLQSNPRFPRLRAKQIWGTKVPKVPMKRLSPSTIPISPQRLSAPSRFGAHFHFTLRLPTTIRYRMEDRVLGRGHYSVVLQGTRLSDGQVVAVKVRCCSPSPSPPPSPRTHMSPP